MMIKYIFFILITVSFGRCDETCFERYHSCVERARDMTFFPPCRIMDIFMQCLVDTTELCLPLFSDTVQKYQIMIDEGCQSRSNFFQRVGETKECLQRNSPAFEVCELEGEFHDVADLCSSMSSLINCTQLTTESVCGRQRGNTFQQVLSPIQDLFGDCRNSKIAKGTELKPCFKQLVNCNPHIFTRSGYTCPDLVRVLTCYVDVAEESCDLDAEKRFAARIIRRVAKQIPEYCNPRSAIRQSLTNIMPCYMRRHSSLEPCHEQYQKALVRALGHKEASDEMTIAFARASVEYSNCWVTHLGTACGEEGAFVAKYVSEPFVAAADDTCVELTGEKCNGVVGVKSTILLLILSLMYILTKEDE